MAGARIQHTFGCWNTAIPIAYDDFLPEIVHTNGLGNTSLREHDDTISAMAHVHLQSRVPEGKRVVFDVVIAGAEEAVWSWYAQSEELSLVLIQMTGTRASAIGGLTVPSGFHKSDDEERYSNYIGANVITNDAGTMTIIRLPSNYTLETWHRIASSIPKIPCLIPWFAGDKKVTEEEIKLMKSLTMDGADFVTYIQQWEQQWDVREIVLKKYLNNFVTDNTRNLIERAKSEREDAEYRIQDYLDKLARQYRALEDAVNRITMYESRTDSTAETEKSLFEFLGASKNIDIVERRGSEVYMYIKSTLSVWDNDELETYVSNPNSLFYYNLYDNTKDFMKYFFTEVFLKRRFDLRVVAKWGLNSACNCHSISQNASWSKYENYLPNPHLRYHNCIGRHSDLFANAASRMNYEEAISVAVQSTAGMSWSDSTVFNELMRDIFRNYYDSKIFNYEGNLLTPREVIEILKGEFTNEAH